MKKTFVLLLVVVLSFALVAIALGLPYNDVTSTKHNLSTGSSNTFESTNEDQICVFCHTPHQAGTSTDPLWNHTLSSVATYGVYASSTFNGSATDIGGGTATSNLCMSCHDGTIAVNALYNPSNDLGANPTMTGGGGAGTAFITSAANLGQDLSNDHPVNFVYDNALETADGGLADVDAAPATCGTGTYRGNFNTDYPGQTITARLLDSTRVQCSSCHGAHIYYGGAQAGYAPFLKVDNTGSGLCLSCHCK